MENVATQINFQTKEISLIIVEDYKLTRVGLRSVLNEFDGLSVIGEAQSGEEAIEKVKSLNPDVVLMDLGLPGMNGLEATTKIKEIMPKCEIIMLTSHERDEEITAALGCGASGYCLKDITPDLLADTIKNVYKGACFLSPKVRNAALKAFPKPENTNLSTKPKYDNIKAQLTERELEVLKHLVDGKSNTEIANELIVSVHTAKAHVCSILQKLCVEDRVQAAVKAIRENIV